MSLTSVISRATTIRFDAAIGCSLAQWWFVAEAWLAITNTATSAAQTPTPIRLTSQECSAPRGVAETPDSVTYRKDEPSNAS